MALTDTPSVRDAGTDSRRFLSSAGRQPGWRRVVLALFLPVLLGRPEAGAAEAGPLPLPSFETWAAACRRLPTNRELGMRPIPRALLPLKSYRDFAAVLDPLLDQQRTGPLSRPEAWLGSPPPASFLDLAVMTPPEGQAPFLPFAQRHALPEGARVFLMGDLHGDIHSLLTYLQQLNQRGVLQGFKLTAAADRLAFLGDYTDRGRFGVEVLYTLLRLRLANPDRVLLARGNHEDVLLLSRYGFVAEVVGKYGKEWDLRRTARFFDFLPAVLYLGHGTNWIQCNHGGMEPGYDPARLIAASGPAVTYQLLGRLEQRRWLTQDAAWVARLPAETRRELERSLIDFVPESPTTPTVLGFMWNDFTVLPSDPQFGIDPGRAFVYGSETSRRVLARSAGPEGRVRALFRGHQHAMVLNPLMRRLMASRGLYRHWQESDHVSLLEAAPAALQAKLEVGEERTIPEGSVWTFNVSPDSMYGAGCGYDFGTYGELVPASHWEAWRIKVHTFEPLEAARERSP